jgi:hypothetical protein
LWAADETGKSAFTKMPHKGAGLRRATPDKRYEHPLFHAPATRKPPDSGKTGLTIKDGLPFSFCPLSFAFLQGVLAQRKPILLLRSSGSLPLRMAHTTFCG